MSAAQSEPLAQAGWALIRAGNARGAIRQFNDALAADPENTNALAGLAQAHLNLDELALADQAAGDLVRIAPNGATGHRVRAEILRRRKRPCEAAKVAREAVALDPREPLGFHILALCSSDRKEHQAAIAICDQGLAVAPASPVLLAQRADNLLELRGPKAALADIEAALRLSPDSEYVLRVAARIALAQNQLERTRDLLSIVLRRNANNRAAVSLFLMAEPGRHGILRGLYIFRYWRKAHGALGWAAYLGVWAAFIIVALLLALVTNVAGLFLGLGIRFFLKSQYDAHAREVQAHFAKFALSSGF
jgi:tetratricopeptide (TPR) repeat protein